MSSEMLGQTGNVFVCDRLKMKAEDGFIEQAVEDVAVVTSALLQLAEHFGLNLDEFEVAAIAGYLRECAEQDTPRDIVTAIRGYFEDMLKPTLTRYCFWQQVIGESSVN